MQTAIETSKDETAPSPVKVTDDTLEVTEIKKGKKNYSKFFHKLLKVDKEAFGDIDQTSIMKTFWNSRANKITICK